MSQLFLLIGAPIYGQGIDNVFRIPSKFLGEEFVGSGNFNALIFGNHTANSGDTEGRLAVAGNFDFTQSNSAYSVGLSAGTIGSSDAPNDTDNFIVNHNVGNSSNSSWQVQGNYITNTKSGTALSPTGNTTLGVTDHIIFSDIDFLSHYQVISTELNEVPQNGTIIYPGNLNPIVLNGTDMDFNVFTVTLPASNEFSGFSINIPSGATALVNITNTNAVINGGSMIINGEQISGFDNYDAGTRVLFNFPNATSVNLTSFGLLASVIAPFADFTASGGSINGQTVIGGNVIQEGGFEFHNFYFEGEIPEMVLPVVLSSFRAHNSGDDVVIDWSTSSESNVSHFNVQRSADGKSWSTIGQVELESNTYKGLEKFYEYVDETPLLEIGYYRLKTIDLDGVYEISQIVTVKNALQSNEFDVYPNPVQGNEFRISGLNSNEVQSIQIFDTKGMKIQSYFGKDYSSFSTDTLISGSYILQIITSNESVITRKFIVQK